jgi:hypothetical protein
VHETCQLNQLVEGFEPPTRCLQNSCSTPELHQRIVLSGQQGAPFYKKCSQKESNLVLNRGDAARRYFDVVCPMLKISLMFFGGGEIVKNGIFQVLRSSAGKDRA